MVLIRSGELHAVVDGIHKVGREPEFIELPAGSVHAIWCSAAVEFEVMGQRGLGLTMIVPSDDGGVREIPIYLREGPWSQRPPRGQKYSEPNVVDELRRASSRLIRP
jgi:hypothetical protein